MSFSLTKAKEITLDILFPPICIACEKSLLPHEKDRFICENCFSGIQINSTLTCPVCRARLADNKKICHKEASYRLAAAANYDNELVKNLIWQLKFQKKTVAAKILGEILFLHLSSFRFPLASFLLIPIPLHKNRKRERGFNQSELIAEALEKKTGLPMVTNALIRIKDTPPQTETRDFEERKKNMEKSFMVLYPDLIKNKNIILIDDVFTSGSTITEAVKTLKSHGAKRVIALTVAKA